MITDTFIEVKLNDPDSFLKIKETLTRIGIASKKDRILYQSCHILHKRGLYYITHFKEMFLLDGKPSSFTDEDRQRRNAVANLLEQWNLLTVVDKTKTSDMNLKNLKVIKHSEKADWTCIQKYSVGRTLQEG